MLLAEDLVLLLVDRPSGELPRHAGTQSALAAAILIDLATSGRLAIDDGDPPMVRAVDPTPLGDPELDAARADGAVPDLIKAIAPGVYIRLLDRLTERGLLTKSRRWWTLGLTSTKMWRRTRHPHRDNLRAHVSAVLFGLASPDIRSGALISLLYVLNALDPIFEGDSVTAYARAEAIAEGEWAADEVTMAIIEASREAGFPSSWDIPLAFG